jgi:uncharacterized protein YodC (DUF2158 family)
MALNKGTKVWLKSGGPAMVIKHMDRYGKWICTWFVGTEIKEHDFSPEQLTEEDPNI